MLAHFKSYQMALELYKKCEHIKAKAFLKDQLERASLSVVLNLVEGSAKTTAKERARFYSMSYASLRETQALLEIMNQKEAGILANQLGGMIYRLKSK